MQEGRERAPATRDVGRYLAIVILAVLTASCAGLRPDSPNEEKVKVVTERATARWKAIIGKDFAAAYEMMSPASRATVTEAGFRTIASRLNYKDAEVKGVTCEAEVCKVMLLITYDTKIDEKRAFPARGIVGHRQRSGLVRLAAVIAGNRCKFSTGRPTG